MMHKVVAPIFDMLGPLTLSVLHPAPYIRERIDALLALLGSNFTAVHIRRTDKNGAYASDTRWTNWAKGFPEKVFAAVDNPKSYQTFKEQLGDRLVASGRFTQELDEAIVRAGKKILRHQSTRMTTVPDAVVDMWVVSYSGRFCGSSDSTFSRQIEQLRAARRPLNGNTPGHDIYMKKLQGN
jgi:hypothetical protein